MRQAAFIFLFSALFFGFLVCSTNGQSGQLIVTTVFDSAPLSQNPNNTLISDVVFPLTFGTFEGRILFTTTATNIPIFHICILANYKVAKNSSDWNSISCTYYSTIHPSVVPESPTSSPTQPSTTPEPTTLPPTIVPTEKPTLTPTNEPTPKPTETPTHEPTREPTRGPTNDPTHGPTHDPTHGPTNDPTHEPTTTPTHTPSHVPTETPTHNPTQTPTPFIIPPSNPPTAEREPTPEPSTPPTTREPINEPTIREPINEPTIREPVHQPNTEPIHPASPKSPDVPTTLRSLQRSKMLGVYLYHAFNFSLPSTGAGTNYSIGVWYYNQTLESKETVSVTLSFQTQGCTENGRVPPLCVPEIELQNGLETQISTGSYFRTTVKPYTPELNLSFNVSQNSKIMIYASSGTIPSPNSHQYFSTNEIIIPSPSIGVWHFFVTSDVAVNAKTILSNETCDPAKNLFGPNCATNVTLAPDLVPGQTFNIEIETNKLGYFRIPVAKSNPLDLYIAHLPQGGVPFNVYVKEGNLPNINGTGNDANGCTFDASLCFATRVRLDPLQSDHDRVYFVTIENINKTATFAIWTDAMCANNCSDPDHTYYKCTDQFGKCSCGIDAIRLNFYCGPLKPSPPLPVPYIVLITIGSLVALSAIIGFLAWIYMRKKRIRYEKV